MPKRYKFLLIAFAGVLGTVIFALVISGIFKSSDEGKNPDSEENIPEYVLSQDEEEKVREFVKNFVFLYNTYSYADYSNLTATGDYQTPFMYSQTESLIAELEKNVPIGFYQTVSVNESSFNYSYPSADTLRISVQMEISEQYTVGAESLRYNSSEDKTYVATANLILKRNVNRWLVDVISLNKK